MASWKTVVPETGLETNEYLLVATRTIDHLGWKLRFISDHGLIVSVPLSANSNSWGETVTIWFTENGINLESKSNGFVLSNKRNQKNIEGYLSLFDEVQYTIRGEEKESLQQWLSENKSSGESDKLNPASSSYINPAKPEVWYMPRGDFMMTAILIGICVLVFVLMVATGANIFSPDMDSLIRWGANAKPLTVVEGEWWRIFTCMFEHIGIFHLAVNMVSLYMVGMLLEPLIGKWRFLASFIVTGTGGSIASLIWNPDVASAGASGAIFGLFGVLLALLTTNLIEKTLRNSILPNIVIIIVINLVAGFRPGVDYAAHIGGLITGLVLGYFFYLITRTGKKPEQLSLVFSILLGIGIAIGGLKSLESVRTDFARIVNNAADYEEKGLKIYKDMEKAGDLLVIKYLGEQTIPAWQNHYKELTKLDALKLPPDLQKEKQTLKEYSQLRLKYFELLRKSMKEDTNQYEDEMIQTNERIAQILDDFKKEKEASSK